MWHLSKSATAASCPRKSNACTHAASTLNWDLRITVTWYSHRGKTLNSSGACEAELLYRYTIPFDINHYNHYNICKTGGIAGWVWSLLVQFQTSDPCLQSFRVLRSMESHRQFWGAAPACQRRDLPTFSKESEFGLFNYLTLHSDQVSVWQHDLDLRMLVM